MGRKKQEAAGQPELLSVPPVEQEAKQEEPPKSEEQWPMTPPEEAQLEATKPKSKMEAVRQLLKSQGMGLTAADGSSMAKRLWDLEITEAMFAAYKSQIKSKQEEGIRGMGHRAAPVATTMEPTLSEVTKVLVLLTGKDIQVVISQIEYVEKLAGACGGLENLKKVLEVIVALREVK